MALGQAMSSKLVPKDIAQDGPVSRRHSGQRDIELKDMELDAVEIAAPPPG